MKPARASSSRRQSSASSRRRRFIRLPRASLARVDAHERRNDVRRGESFIDEVLARASHRARAAAVRSDAPGHLDVTLERAMSTARCARAPRVAPARAPSASATTTPRARARATRARAFWDRFGGSKTDDVPSGENVDADARATATATATTTTRAAKPTAEDSLSALSALLGEDEREAKAARELEEADARRAEAQARERERKEAGAARRREFVKADAATTRIQRLQAVFLDVPLGMLDFSTMKDKTPGGRRWGRNRSGSSFPQRCSIRSRASGSWWRRRATSGLELKPKGSGESEGESGEIVRLARRVSTSGNSVPIRGDAWDVREIELVRAALVDAVLEAHPGRRRERDG